MATAGTINPVLKSQYFLPAKEELTLQEGGGSFSAVKML